MFLPAELERGTKALHFDVCCKAIDRNFNCGSDHYIIYIIWTQLHCQAFAVFIASCIANYVLQAKNAADKTMGSHKFPKPVKS